MNDDIFKSVSQGSNGAYDEENRRIQEISDELQRLCQLHEAQSGAGQADGGRFEIEQRVHIWKKFLLHVLKYLNTQ